MSFKEIIGSFARKNLPHSEVEFSGEVPAEAIASYRQHALKDIAATLELPGFRKGMVPPDLALKKVGEMAILEEAAELFMRDFYPELVVEQNLDVVGRPAISITKLAPNTPVAFVIRTALYPAVTLPPNWKKLTADVLAETPGEVTDKEIDETLASLQKSRATTDAEGKEALPELSDAFAQSLGAFADLANLKEKLRQGIGEEKARAARDKRRAAIIDALLEKTQIDIPQIFVESEIEKIIAQLKDDVARFGLTFEEYLKRLDKTEEALRNEYREQAAKRAKLQLTLNEIAKVENITADKEAVEEEMKHALEHFPDADPERLGVHVQTVLRNEKILKMLEGEGEKKEA